MLIKTVKTLLFSFLFYGLLTSCSSSDDAGASSEEDDLEAVEREEDEEKEAESAPARASGNATYITTSLNNRSQVEGSIPNQTLSTALLELDDMSKKKPSPDLLLTLMSLLRMTGTSPDLYEKVKNKVAVQGGKDPWFALEATYRALRRQEFSFADYLMDKAQKNAKSKLAKVALAYTRGLREFLSGNNQEGIVMMKKAALRDPAWLPAILTVGFMGLRAGDARGSLSLFQRAVDTHPRNVNAKIGFATALRMNAQYSRAVQVLTPVYNSRKKDKRIVWNYALALGSDPSQKKKALRVLDEYFSLPGRLPRVIDDRATKLQQKLQRPPAAKPKPAAAKPKGKQ